MVRALTKSGGERGQERFLEQVMAELSFGDEDALTGQVKDKSGQGGENISGKEHSNIKGMETRISVN